MLYVTIYLVGALVWLVLLHSWAAFFTALGILNLWIAYHFDTDTWVSFKLFGGLGLMLVFVLLQGVYLSRYISEDKTTEEPLP